MALKKVKGNFDRFFDKNLTDLIRGIRNNKDNEARYISQCMEEIKLELKQDNVAIKANAVAKLTYLQMHGYDISWSAFNVIEVMASVRFTDKRIGYLCASVSFNDKTDVLMLTTNMIRKELNSTSIYEAGVALGGLSCFITSDLARDLANDIVTLLTSSKPYVRKRAVLLLYKVFLKYPDALRPTFSRLKDKLEDPDPGVQSAAVNVICELARKNPQNYLSLAPVFFKLMTTSSNNWMLIKIIKLFGALIPLEPRLEGKLLEPLTSLINSTSAMSLLYECINTVTAVLISVSSRGDHQASIQLCVQKLGGLIEDQDQNLKYLGLLALGKILKTYPKAVQAHKDQVLQCLDDKDESIRLRALDLLYGMVSKKNIMEIVKRLMQHVDSAEGSNYRDELLSRIINICSHSNYMYITNFEWYISVLVELTKVEGTRHGALISHQMLDVAVRVQSIRHFAVSQMALLIENAQLLLAGSVQQRSNMCEVLLSASWICGEYSQHLVNPQSCLESMLRTKVSLMPGHIQSSFVQNIGKLYSVLLSDCEKEDDWDRIYTLDNLMLSKLPQFEQTEHLEAQERACSLIQLMKIVDLVHKKQEKIGADVELLFGGELNPIAPKAQRKVPVPEGLDLDAWINEPPIESEESEAEVQITPQTFTSTNEYSYSHDSTPTHDVKSEAKRKADPSKEDIRKMRQERHAEYESNPNYLKGSGIAPQTTNKRPNQIKLSKKLSQDGAANSKLPQVQSIDLTSPLEIPGMVGLGEYMDRQENTLSWKKAKKEKRKKKKGKRVISSSSSEDGPSEHFVNREDGEMPDGAKSTDDENDNSNRLDPFKALDMNLDAPLRDDEKLPESHHRITSPVHKMQQKHNEKVKKNKKKKHGNENEMENETKHRKKKKEKREKPQNGVLLLDEPQATNGGLEKDLDDWLSPTIQPIATTQVADTKPPKKAKSVTKKKSSKKSKIREGESLQVHDRNDYEIASGVCTPSKDSERMSQSPAPPNLPMTNVVNLANNQHCNLTCETSVNPGDQNLISVTLNFQNTSQFQLRQLELSVVDSLNTRLLKEDGGPAQGSLPLPLILAPNSQSQYRIVFSVHECNLAQKLRGTITYIAQDENGSTADKWDIRLHLPCIAFNIPATISRAAFSQILSEGTLIHKCNVKFDSTDQFNIILNKICFHAKFTVVEQMENSASLYSQNIKTQPICLLLKYQSPLVTIDGKSTDASIIENNLQEIKNIFIST